MNTPTEAPALQILSELLAVENRDPVSLKHQTKLIFVEIEAVSFILK